MLVNILIQMMVKQFPAYMTWSMLISLQPSFYPTEADEKGKNVCFLVLNFVLELLFSSGLS